jgi:hypothetical protein
MLVCSARSYEEVEKTFDELKLSIPNDLLCAQGAEQDQGGGVCKLFKFDMSRYVLTRNRNSDA